MRHLFSLLALAIFLLPTQLRADTADEVSELVKAAKAALKAHQQSALKPAEYAQCIYNLEKAQALLENAGDSSSNLAQEVNSTLFWAKRFSNMAISNELAKIHATGGLPKVAVKPAAPPPKPAAASASGVADIGELSQAKAAYETAEKFAKQSKDPYAVSLRWFQMASQHSGTEYAMKALDNARQAQALIPKKPADSAAANAQPSRALLEAQEAASDKPEYALMREADKLAASKDLEGAIEKYKASIKLKDNIPAQRRLGHVYFQNAQKLQETLMPKYEPVDREYATAFANAYISVGNNRYFNERNPALVAAKQKVEALRKESDNVLQNYVSAQACFEKILSMSPDKKDFDSAAFIGVCMAKRKSASFRARGFIADFLKNYQPADGTEQITYEYCKSEYDRVSH